MIAKHEKYYYFCIEKFKLNQMKSSGINSIIIEGYLKLLNYLSRDSKLELISRLTLSLKKGDVDNKMSFFDAFGGWQSTGSSEKLVSEIKSSRNYNR